MPPQSRSPRNMLYLVDFKHKYRRCHLRDLVDTFQLPASPFLEVLWSLELYEEISDLRRLSRARLWIALCLVVERSWP